jgi:hypothetical protein
VRLAVETFAAELGVFLGERMPKFDIPIIDSAPEMIAGISSPGGDSDGVGVQRASVPAWVGAPICDYFVLMVRRCRSTLSNLR